MSLRQRRLVLYVSKINHNCSFYFESLQVDAKLQLIDEEADDFDYLVLEDEVYEVTLKKCRSTYEKFMQKVEKTGLLEPAPDPE